MRITLSLILIGIMWAGSVNAETLSAKDYAIQYAKIDDDLAQRMEIVEQVAALPGAETERFYQFLQNLWTKQQTDYTTSFAKQTQMLGRERQSTNANRAVLRKTRKLIEDIHEDGLPDKVALREKAWPAIVELKRRYQLTPAQVVEREDLALRRRKLKALAKELAYLHEALLKSGEPPVDWDALENKERFECARATFFKARDRTIMLKNAKKADALSKEEYACIRDLNLMRILLGLNALELDLKLCEASRGHSQDMQEQGFFAHESPVRGKETPDARAKKAGTSASSENIARGDQTGESVNRGWFHSPGHHENMFGRHRRIGVGKFGGFWTQMFG